MSLLNRALDAAPEKLVRAAIHRFWKYQEPELQQLSDYLDPTRNAVDIGGWWGPWTAELAKHCPQVHCFEPQPKLASGLRSWAPANVVVHENAVGDTAGIQTLNRPDDLPGTDGLATLRSSEDHQGDSISVEVTTIDSCALTDVGFIKIDVEGLELAALRGGEQTIERDQPRLMIEIEQRHLDQPIDNVFQWVIDRGYEGWFWTGTMWVGLDNFDVARDQVATVDKPKSLEYINAFLFTPESHGWKP